MNETYKHLIDTEDPLNKAILDGIKESLKNQIKEYFQKDLDKALEEIACELASRFFIRMSDHQYIHDFGKTIRLELLTGRPENLKKYKVENITKVVEVIN